nr:glucosidase 2 subunit beta [Quercus suber]
MKGITVLLCLEHAALVFSASENARPRGVGPEFAKFYKDREVFTCISNPLINIPLARVNDDYCDCPDGSDEPGTSACSHLSPLSPHTPADTIAASVNTTLALPGFYCKNKGHIPSYVPFTSVNDGICDYEQCCDGSEEWEGVGGVKCEDRCNTVGKEWRKHDEARQKSLGNAARKRKELVAEAAKMRLVIEEKVITLKSLIEAGEINVKSLEQEFADVEKKERGRVVKGSVSNKAGKLGVLVGLAKQRTEELRSNLIRVRTERDASISRLQELESLLSTFKEEYNPNFNDEGVKRAVRAWEDYAARDKGAGVDPAQDRDLDAIAREDHENGIVWDEYTGDDEEDETDVLYQFEQYLPPSVRTWVDQKLRDLRLMLIDNGILADSGSSASGSESKAVTNARNRLDSAKKDLETNNNDLNSANEDLAKDFGPDDVFRALKGVCAERDSGEYTYEVCFLEKTTQKPKKGGGHTNMGNYVRLEKVMVDDEPRADGKGLGSGERWAMKYENGQHCWNGPSRSTTVVLACSEQNEVWKIMEEEKCVYRVEVGTPAVCETKKAGEAPPPARDEL